MRVVIAEDSVLLREGLARVLADAGIEVAARWATRMRSTTQCARAARRRRRRRPHAADADRRGRPRRPRDPRRSTRRWRSSSSRRCVEARHALELFSEQPEGFGYLLKDRVVEVDEFLESVRRVGRGGTAMDPEVSGSSSAAARAPTRSRS